MDLYKSPKKNPKIDARESGHEIPDCSPEYTNLFKPPYNVKYKKLLLSLLQDYDRKGLRGVFMENLQESLPHCDKIIHRLLDDDKILVLKATDEKKVAFLRGNAKKFQFHVDEEFQKLWRSIAVDSLDDMKIEEYLRKTGFAFMQDQAEGRKAILRTPKKKFGGVKR